jgi:hypothetical protein
VIVYTGTIAHLRQRTIALELVLSPQSAVLLAFARRVKSDTAPLQHAWDTLYWNHCSGTLMEVVNCALSDPLAQLQRCCTSHKLFYCGFPRSCNQKSEKRSRAQAHIKGLGMRSIAFRSCPVARSWKTTVVLLLSATGGCLGCALPVTAICCTCSSTTNLQSKLHTTQMQTIIMVR